MLFRPNFLTKGDKVYILSTARKVERSELDFSINLLKSLDLEVIIGNSIEISHHQYAGTEEERAADFQKALNDPEIKAILFARGGYGSIRIFDKIDWSRFIETPKWLIGFSDITIWHNLVNNFYGIETLHAPMCITLKDATPESLLSFKNTIMGHLSPITFEINPQNKNTQNTVKGDIIGGNLSILYSLIGTDTGFNTNNKILFIEDLDEYLYHIDRMMIALKRAKKLEGLKALVVGGFTEIKDNQVPFGKNYIEIILEHCSSYQFPIYFDFPVGHINNNHSLILGSTVELSSDASHLKLIYL